MTRLTLAMLSCALAVTAAPATPFKLEDVRRIVNLSDPQIAPDGRHIAVLVARRNWDENKNDQEIDLVDAGTGRLRPLTWKRTGLSSPRWSPGGDRLAFLAEDPETKKGQLFVAAMDGGDPRRLSDGKQDVASFSWSPDGTRIAFYRQDDIDEDALKHHRDVLQVTDNHYLSRASVPPWHVWVVPAAGGKAQRLTQGGWSVETADQGSGTPLAWSRDGRSIAFARFPSQYYARSSQATIGSVGADGTGATTLVADPGAVAPQFAPKGDGLAFLRPRAGDPNNGGAVYLRTGAGSEDLTRALAMNISDYAWLPDGSGLLLHGEDHAQAVLWRQPLKGAATRLQLGPVSVLGFSIADTGAVAMIGATASHPRELYLLDRLDGKPRQLTHFNDFVDPLNLGRTVAIDWDGPDGFKEDGLLTYPVDYVAGRRYPLVLVMHGGPAGASVLNFDPLEQLLAAKGFLVFQPNYRGSTNLGDAYQHAIYQDTGEGPGLDVMAGLAAVKALGVVDEARIGISGWSYGGYMTSWLNGRYPGWKAAVEGAALNDWLTDYTLSYYQEGDMYLFGASPYGKDETIARMWREQSPIALARRVVTPTLILGCAGDPNVTIVNSYEMYHVLRDQGVPVEFYTYPLDVHFPGDIVHRTDVYERWVNWMEKHLN